MRLGKDLIDKLVVSVSDGRLVGKVKDLYLDNNLEAITGLYLGSEGIFSRKPTLLRRDQVILFGLDAVLVKDSNVVIDSEQIEEFATWLRRNDLQGREVDTSGGTKVGMIGDVILNDEGGVVGFKLARVFVEGPIAKKQAVARDVVIEVGQEDGIMTIDLTRAEQQSLSLE
jgi:uncharacterized protein YrrD